MDKDCKVKEMNQPSEDAIQRFEDYVKDSPGVKTEIHWWDLYGGHYVKMNRCLQKEVFQKAIKKAGCFTFLSRELNINRRTIAECSKGKRDPQISILLKVANFVDFPLDDIERNIIEISNLTPKFPFRLDNPCGAEIRAAFLSDGHIPGNPIKCPMYLALETDLHESLITLCKEIFGDFTTKTVFNGRAHTTRFPAVIGTALELSGVPRGKKGSVNIFIPKDILLGSERMTTSYLRRVFDDEGDVCFDKHGKRAVRVTRSACILDLDIDIAPINSQKWTSVRNSRIPLNTLLLGERLLLCNLGIDAKMYSEGVYKSLDSKITAKWRIQIGQQDSLKKFSELVNFSLKEKKERLLMVLNSYKIKEFPNGEGEKFVIRFLQTLYAQKHYFTFGDLGKEFTRIGRSHDLAGRYLKILIEKKIIKKMGRGKYVFCN